MSRLPDPPERVDGSRCSLPGPTGKACGLPRHHLGMTDRGDVWLCSRCDMAAGAMLVGPPRLVNYIKTGEPR